MGASKEVNPIMKEVLSEEKSGCLLTFLINKTCYIFESLLIKIDSHKIK